MRDGRLELLVCPKCAASDRPGATMIERDYKTQRALCMVCAKEGPIEEFQPEDQR